VELKQIIFVIELNIEAKNPKDSIRKIRAARNAIKTAINGIDGAKATRIQNKDKA
jgi:hypothetical protein